MILFVALIGSGTYASAIAQGTGSGTITGTVTNGTSGGPAVGAGMDVTLVATADGQMVNRSFSKTGEDGRFTFEGLSTDVSYTYQVLTTYLGVNYTSDDITFAPDESSKTANVKVYETTNSDVDVSVMVGHVVFYPGNNVLQVNEFYVVVNSGDRTFTGGSRDIAPDGKRRTLSLSLPKGAANLQYSGGLPGPNTFPTGDGLITTMPVVPGMNEVGYSYDIKNDSNRYVFTKTIGQNTARMDILVQGAGIRIAGEGLNEAEPLEIQGTLYAHATRENLKAGDVLTAQLSGLASNETQNVVPWVVMALGVLTVGGSAGYFLKRRRQQPAPAMPHAAIDESESLLAGLARLDDEFERGKIAEQDYRRLRAARKAELVRRLQESGNPGRK